MKTTCIILDDDAASLALAVGYAQKVSGLEVVGAYTHPAEAHELLMYSPVNLLITDIDMPDISGLEFVQSLPNPPAVILQTSYPEYAIRGYSINAVDFLVKPYSFGRFLEAVNRALLRIATPQPTEEISQDFLFIRTDGTYIRIAYQEILYIEAADNYSKIITKEKSYISRVSIRKIEEILPDYFIRTHRSYIVNINKIDSVSPDVVSLCGREVPLGNAFRQMTEDKLFKNKHILK